MPILIGSVMLYSVTDIANIIDVHPSTVRKYLREREVTGRKIAGKWYVAAGDLIGWLAEEGYSTTLPAMSIELAPVDESEEPPLEGLLVDFDDELDWRDELADLKAEAKRIAERAKEVETAHKPHSNQA